MLKNARIWSNYELKNILYRLDGDIINVSGEHDLDKMGGYYRDYFHKARSYHISNYKEMGLDDEILIDLEKDLSDELVGRFDVVFNHTILEHIFEIRKAFSNLCKMSREVVVVVVPFVQEVHFIDGVYSDYWRPTPFALNRMFEENDFVMLYMSHNNMEFTNSYIVCVGVKKNCVEKYKWLDNRPHNNHVGSWIQKYGAEWNRHDRNKKKIKSLVFFWKKVGKKNGDK